MFPFDVVIMVPYFATDNKDSPNGAAKGGGDSVKSMTGVSLTDPPNDANASLNDRIAARIPEHIPSENERMSVSIEDAPNRQCTVWVYFGLFCKYKRCYVIWIKQFIYFHTYVLHRHHW